MPAKTVRYQGSGHGGNVATTCLIWELNAPYIPHWGDDLPGIKARQSMLDARVDITLCKVFSGETSQSNVLVNIGKGKKPL